MYRSVKLIEHKQLRHHLNDWIHARMTVAPVQEATVDILTKNICYCRRQQAVSQIDLLSFPDTWTTPCERHNGTFVSSVFVFCWGYVHSTASEPISTSRCRANGSSFNFWLNYPFSPGVTKSRANIEKNLPPGIAVDLFIWTKSSFASTWLWNKQGCRLYNN